MDAAHRGDTALEAKQPAEAVVEFSKAIAQTPTAAAYYIKRSTAYQRCKQYQEALADAEIGVTLAFKRAKRELIAQAQLRRAIALFNLQSYGDARCCLEWAVKYDAKDKLAAVWQSQVNGKLKNLPDDDPKVIVTVKENPDVEPLALNATSNVPAATSKDESNGTKTQSVADSGTTIVASTKPTQTPADKIRHEWYQNSENVYVTLLAKGVPKDKTSVTIDERSLSISFPLAAGSSYDFSLDPLFSAVDVEASASNILSTKIEVTLKKATAGHKWSSLEASQLDPVLTNRDDLSSQPKTSKSTTPMAPSENIAKLSAPSYPTSSRKGPKNWDKIANSYTRPAEDRSTQPGDSAKAPNTDQTDNDDVYIDEFDDGGDEVNAFFKKLYAGASDETKRAMMKSYQESGGTALSTNWEEVKKAPVPVSPPDGMEEKKWEY